MTSPSPRPLSSHPAFPVVVALWFAALLGGGTFVLPASIFENAATATGLADIVPAAQPPLGNTARLAITVAAAILGALIGLFVAWQVRRATRSEHETRGTEKSAHEITSDEAFAPDEHTPTGETDPDDATAWQVWREQMTDEEDALNTTEASDPADALERDSTLDIEDTVPVALDEEPRGEPQDDIDFDAPPVARPSDDDPQRAEADRLVAGLARLRHVDDEPRDLDAAPSVEPLEMEDYEALSFSEESDENDGAAIFDSSFVSADPVAAGEETDDPSGPDPVAEPDDDLPADAPHSEPLTALSLPELVARLELALDARKTHDAEDQPHDDDTVAFLWREAGRADTEEGTSENGDTDSQAMLRAALAKLDQVGRTS